MSYTKPALSASQLQRHAACPAQWGAVYLEGQKEPSSPAADLGVSVHAELEAWLKKGVLPTSKIALVGLPHAPPPGTLGVTVERALSFVTPSSPFRGYVDVDIVYDDEVTIQDWKTTTKLANAKSAEYLTYEDIQSNLYAYEAFVQRDLYRVFGKWVYITTCGTPKAVPVYFEFERQKTIDLVEGPIDTQAAEIQKLYQLRPKWTELEKRTGHCYAYNRQCHVFDKCKPNRQMTITMGAEPMSNDFRAAMQQSFPGAGAPPPPPAAPKHWEPGMPMNFAQMTLANSDKPLWLVASAADNPPPADVAMAWPGGMQPYYQGIAKQAEIRHTRIVPETDRGFVNPPEAPTTPSPNPEAAAARQGIEPPPAPVADDLDSMPRDQLKALAVSLGAIPENSRAREQSIREAIRSIRSGVSVAPPPPPAVTLTPEDVHPAPSAPPPLVEPAPRQFTAPKANKAYELFVNCHPMKGNYTITDFHQLLQLAHEQIRKTKPEIQDYRQIQYTALADINLALREVLSQGGFNAIVVDSRTPDGAAVLTTLEAGASCIVRGF